MAEEKEKRVCTVCGKPLTGRQQRYCSAECRSKFAATRAFVNYTPVRGKQGIYREQTCIDCGKPFYGHIKSKRCRECREEAKRWYARKAQERAKLGKTRKIGSTDFCEACGEPYIVTSGAQRYCKKCAPIAVAENIRAKARERTAEYYRDEAHREEKAEARRTKVNEITVCAICGKQFELHGTYRKYCSPECADKALKQYNDEYDKNRRSTPESKNYDDWYTQQRKANAEHTSKTCPQCGKEFQPHKTGTIQYCSIPCALAAKNEARAKLAQPVTKTCPVCGSEFVPNGSGQIYCSPKCQRKSARKSNPPKKRTEKKEIMHVCKFCGQEFKPKQPGQRYCSDECHKKWKAERVKQKSAKEKEKRKLERAAKQTERTCKNCGATFVGVGNECYCSKACRKAAKLKESAASKRRRRAQKKAEKEGALKEGGKRWNVTILTDESQKKFVEDQAAKLGITQSEYMRILLEREIARQDAEREKENTKD